MFHKIIFPAIWTLITFFCLSLFSITVSAQLRNGDTLFFQNRKDGNKTFDLVLGERPLTIKTKDHHRRRVQLVSFSDSTFIAAVYASDTKTKRVVHKILHNSSLKKYQKDSLVETVVWSNRTSIKLSQLEKLIVVDDRNSAKRKGKFVTKLGTAWLIGLPFVIATSTSPGGLFIYLASVLPIITYVGIIGERNINLRDWKLVNK